MLRFECHEVWNCPQYSQSIEQEHDQASLQRELESFLSSFDMLTVASACRLQSLVANIWSFLWFLPSQVAVAVEAWE